MASLIVAGDTSGSVTIAAPAIASTPTLTLPTVSGTFITTGSSGQSIPKAALPTGSVLQVVQFSTNSTVATTSTSFVTTGFSASITPTASTSRILILVSAMLYSDTTAAEPQLTIYKGGSNITSTALADLFSSAGRIVGGLELEERHRCISGTRQTRTRNARG